MFTLPVSSKSKASPFSQTSFTEVPTLIESNNVFSVPVNNNEIVSINETWRVCSEVMFAVAFGVPDPKNCNIYIKQLHTFLRGAFILINDLSNNLFKYELVTSINYNSTF